MKKLFGIGALLLSFGLLSSIAQAPALEIFTSPDGAFRFVYPQNYQLLVGEHLLRATQGRHQSLPVCNFSTAIACVVYPFETEDDTRFEAAGFSVDSVPDVSAESDCLTYSDQSKSGQSVPFQLTSIAINERVFRHISTRKIIPGHLQTNELYRAFIQRKCYQLQIAVSLADGVLALHAARSGSLGNIAADNARDSLLLVLSSFAFRQ